MRAHWAGIPAAIVAVFICGYALTEVARSGSTTTSAISAYPTPGTPVASARTQISLRGAPPRMLGKIRVSGSRSGNHPGRLVAHSDGMGASFIPRRPFTPGERVSVSTDLRIVGARNGDYTLTIARNAPDGARATRRERTLRPDEVRSYRTQPRLRPPVVSTTQTADTAPGYLFIGPKKSAPQDGPLVVDNNGEPVFFRPLRAGLEAFDVRVQTYRDRPVMTWWEGRLYKPGYGRGTQVIVDDAYRRVATVRPGNGYAADLHDFVITKRNTAYLIAYQPVRYGSFQGRRGVIDCIVQEVDLATGLVLFEWHSLPNLSLSESYTASNYRPVDPYDPVHLNSVDELPDGDLLLSGRNTHAAYTVDRETGRVTRRLGGKRSNIRMGRGTRFAWQHDIRRQPDGTITIFDNEAAPQVGPQSRGITLRIDGNRASLVREYTYPGRLVSNDQANMQVLPNGHVLLGWGPQPHATEHTADGRMIFDATLPRGVDTYRAYRFPWTGRPADRPAVAVTPAAGGLTVYASWNGATEVARWEVLAGSSASDLRPVASAPRSGFETAISAPAGGPLVAVRALGAGGEELGTSATVQP